MLWRRFSAACKATNTIDSIQTPAAEAFTGLMRPLPAAGHLDTAGFWSLGRWRGMRPCSSAPGVDELVLAGDRLNLFAAAAFVGISGTSAITSGGACRCRNWAHRSANAQTGLQSGHLSAIWPLRPAEIRSRYEPVQRYARIGDVMLLGSEVVSQFLTVIVLFIALLSYSLELSVVLLLTMPLVVCASLIFRYLARIVTRQGARAMAVVNDNIQESVTGISIAKNFRQEAMIYNEFSTVNVLSYVINLRRGFVMSLVFPTLGVLSAIALSIVIWSGARSVLSGAISAGAWFLFSRASTRFWFPFMNLASFWSSFQKGLSAAERIFALIDAETCGPKRQCHPKPRCWQSPIRKCRFPI